MNLSRTCVILSQSGPLRHLPGASASRLVGMLLLVWGSLLFLGSNPVHADELPKTAAETLEVTGVSDPGADYAPDPATEVPGGGVGFMTRIGHIAGETVGREDSITHVGLAPYVFHEETMLFSDLRLYRTNEGHTGGNAGLGLRHYLMDTDSIFGVIGYYDNDDSRGTEFQQLGLSLEYLSRWYDVRVNWYKPIDDTERVISTNIVNGSQQFFENQLLFDRRTVFGSAADGVDLLVSTPIPGEIPEAFNWEVSAGAYHYQVPDSDIDKMWGWRLRSDADMFKRILHMFVELTSDNVTDTNIVVGAALNYYHGFENRRRLQDSQFYRMSEWVRRNYTVVTINDAVITEDEVARNPETGDPYYFAHVENIPGVTMDSGDGTVEDPYQFIQEAQDFLQASDPVIRDNGVIYVHGDSVFTGDEAVVVMNDGEIILGEGEGDDVIQTLPVFGISQPVMLPIVIPDGALPQLLNANGTAVTAASDNTFSGFNIINPSGNGILIDTQTDGMFSDVIITNAGLDGVSMTGPNAGAFSFQRVQINNAAGVGFHVDGGAAQVTVNDADNVTLGVPTITNVINEAVLIENTTGGFVNMAQTLVDDDGGAGIRLLNNIGNVTIGQALLDDTTVSGDPSSVGAGLEINGSSGNTTLFDDITITNPSGPGLLIANLADGGTVNASGIIAVNSRNAIGADFANIDGTVQFAPTSSLNIGPVGAGATIDDPGIRFHNGSTGSVILNNFAVNGSLGNGVLIGDPTGALVNQVGAVFRVIGMGSISNTALGDPLLPRAAFTVRGSQTTRDPTVVDFQGTLTSNTRGGRGIHIEHTSGFIAFPGSVIINNNADPQSPYAALFIDDVTGSVGFASFTANNGLGGVEDPFEPPEFEPVVDIQNVLAPASVNFISLNIVDAVGTDALDVDFANQFTVAGGTINVDQGQAVEIANSNINVTFDSVSSSQSPDFGISVLTAPGSFTVLGDDVTFGSGGTISEAGIAGALFSNTDMVSLNLQDYIGNGVLVADADIGGPIVVDGVTISTGGAGAGIVATNMNDDEDDFLFLNALQVSDNEAQGLYTEDVRNVEVEDSIFMSNGAALVQGTQQHISLNVFTNPNDDDLLPTDPDFESFVYVIERNDFFDGDPVLEDDAVLIQTATASAAESRVELFVLDNEFAFNRDDNDSVFRPTALKVDWNGTLAAEIRRNVINMGDGNGQTGIGIFTQDTDTRTDMNIFNNRITATVDGIEDSLRGINLELVGPANVTLNSNEINFTMPQTPNLVENNFGFRFNFTDGNKNIDLVNNLILMNSGTAVGIPLVASLPLARSSFFVSANQFGSATQPPDNGIIFNAVTGSVLLSGNVPNLFFVTGTPFAVLSGNFQGSIP